jgi:hypothetical protein
MLEKQGHHDEVTAELVVRCGLIAAHNTMTLLEEKRIIAGTMAHCR